MSWYLNKPWAPYAHSSPQLIRHQHKTGHEALFTPAQVEWQHHIPAPPTLLWVQSVSNAPQTPAAGLLWAVVAGCLCLPLQVTASSAWREALLLKELLLFYHCTHTASSELVSQGQPVVNSLLNAESTLLTPIFLRPYRLQFPMSH